MKQSKNIHPGAAKNLLTQLFIGLLVFVSATTSIFAQPTTDKKLPTKALGMGIFANTYGSGLKVEYYKLSEKPSLFLDFTLGSVRNLREYKIKSAYSDQNGKDYIWDKRNYLFTLNSVIGISKEILPKSSLNKISLRWSAGAGPILGFLKPYYVEIAVPVFPQGATIDPRPYDASKYTYSDIVGEADFFLGMSEMKFTPGLRAEGNFLLDFAGIKNSVRGAEVGFFADYFFRTPRILDTGKNPNLMLGGSIAVIFGGKW